MLLPSWKQIHSCLLFKHWLYCLWNKDRLLYFLKKYLFIWLHWVLVVACGILFPDQRLNPHALRWELRVLASGPSWKSWYFALFWSFFPLTRLQMQNYSLWEDQLQEDELQQWESLIRRVKENQSISSCFLALSEFPPPFYCFRYLHCTLFYFCTVYHSSYLCLA